jgi:prepilin-type N-terminal cleavage/methylation domain-containing protein
VVVQSSGRAAKRGRRDRGFTLVESMVAMGVLAVIATAAAAMLIHALGVTGSDRQRVRAASVAAQEVERIRGLMQSNPSAITTDAARTVATISPTLFTVTSDVANGGTSYHLVDSGEWSSAEAYKSLRLTVTATWNDMGAVKPVVNSSILTINGAGGNGSGGSVAVSVTPVPVSPDPVVTISPTCDLRRSTIGFSVNSQASVLGVPMLTPLASGTVVAVPASGNPCTTTIPLTLQSGIVTGTLPYGNWTITASMNNLAGNSNSMSLAVNAGATNGGFLNIVDTSSCANTGLVALTVQSKNLIDLVTNLLSTGTVTATRAAASTCAGTSTTFPISLGLGGGNLSYGTWTFTYGNASATATISSGLSLPVVLTATTSTTCPTSMGVANVSANSAVAVPSGTASVAWGSGITGTVLATPATGNPCTGSVPLTYASNKYSGSLPYGTWVLTGTLPDGASGTSSVTVNAASVPATLAVIDNCGGAPTVGFKVQKGLLGIVAANITATRTATATCSTPVTTTFTSLVGGLLNAPIAYGQWNFTGTVLLGGTATGSALIGPGTTVVTLS